MLAIGLGCLTASLVLLFLEFSREEKPEEKVSAPVEAEHRVLLISSYSSLYFTNPYQKAGIEKSFYPRGIEYDVLYMDAKKYDTPEEEEEFYRFVRPRLNRKSNTNRYEAVLAADDNALELLLRHEHEWFTGIPVVYFGVNNISLAGEAARLKRFYGFYEKDYLEDTLYLAMSLYPDSDKIVALHDDSAAGMADMEIFYRFARRHPEKQCTDINTSELTQRGFINRLEQISEDTIVIYMTAYSDVRGNNYSMIQRTNTIVSHTKAPIFRNYVGGVGMGVLGGISLDMEQQAYLAAQKVCALIADRDAGGNSLIVETPSRSEFDYEELQARGLDFSLLPEDTILVNQPVSFSERYGRLFLPAALLLAFFLLLLSSGQITIHLRKLTNQELEASRQTIARARERMQYLAEYDDLLDIYNRRTAVNLMEEICGKDTVFSVILTDIDGIKNINESFGHQETDRILQQLASSLREKCEEEGYLLARYAGDEFLILIPGRQLTERSPELLELMELCHRPIQAGAEKIVLSMSMGISNSDGESTSDEHIANAEIAMYEAKSRGGDGVFLFAEEMKEKLREDARIKEKLLEAFDTEGFYMLYQPQVDAKTKKLCGMEALVRMKAPGMFPGKFIPVAEANGWIWRIGRLTTKLVVKQLAAWRDAGHQLVPVSVNFSSKQLNDSGYLDYVEELLKRYDIPSEYLEIEITEGMFLDRSAQTDSLFVRMQQMGIRLLMDDFGTGYSSLAYLSYIPASVIKLDKSLVDEYLVDGKDSFIRDVIRLVHDLDKGMIIEGVEEEWQYERLRGFGADVIQGYYFSKPIPPEEAIVFQAAEA